MEEAVKRYEELLANIDADIELAEEFKADQMQLYGAATVIDDTIKIQSMVLKIADYISQKRMARVELERQLFDLKDAIAGVKG